MDVFLPHKFNIRPYQQDAFNDFFIKKMKRFVDIWPRRAGKDLTWWNIIIAATQQRVGNYIYAFPKLVQAREVIWEGMDNNGRRFIDYIPKSLIDGQPRSDQMSIRFKNGSRLKLGGSDHYNTIVGGNPIAIVFSEYAIQNPLGWDYLRPILLQNGGWASFIYTPRGGNHGLDLYEMAKTNKDWHCNLLTCEQTFKSDGARVITEEMIKEERNSGMSEDMIEQEYFCSFSAAIRGAYYSRQFKEIDSKNNVRDFMIDRKIPVYTYWDLGIGDSTSIWFVQKKPDDSFDVIYYYENQGQQISHYINKINELQGELGLVCNKHYAPHDSANRSIQTGKTLIDYARDLGFSFNRVPRMKHKEYGIEATRSILPNCRFHQTNCKHGIRCLREYHKEFNERLAVFSETPAHDWSSHAADAFSQFALTASKMNINSSGEIYYNRVNTTSLF